MLSRRSQRPPSIFDQPFKEDNETRLLLIGGTGQGKSSTGNTILRYRAFQAFGGGQSVTKSYKIGYAKIKERWVKIVDVPGFADTEESTAAGQNNLVSNELAKVSEQFPKGFNALLMVLSYKDRLTCEKQNFVRSALRHFGASLLKSYGVLVLTHGDAVIRDFGPSATLKQAVGSGFGQVANICGGRCVVFNNATDNENTKQFQVNKLLDVVDNMQTSGSRTLKLGR